MKPIKQMVHGILPSISIPWPYLNNTAVEPILPFLEFMGVLK